MEAIFAQLGVGLEILNISTLAVVEKKKIRSHTHARAHTETHTYTYKRHARTHTYTHTKTRGHTYAHRVTGSQALYGWTQDIK